ncbi:MAG: ATP-binding cassette domain-containing protein, partial [Dinghuibacter sp.]|nr:ATP-binding cassette domain-containing protein [Dinghuibacter sp.]
FIKKRNRLDYKRFQTARENQDSIFEMVQGMQEIKLNDGEMNKRWSWERIQARLFTIQVKSLAYSQYQELGSVTLNQLKNIFITYLAAQMVIGGSLTLGMMLSIAYIIGQMNGPLDQLINFLTAAQEAKLSLNRLGEVHNRPNEELETNAHPVESNLRVLPHGDLEQRGVGDIVIDNLSFQYEGPHSPHVLQHINLVIPEGKVTAIVGASGSGKTTLMKLLLKFYTPTEGNISIGKYALENLSANWWRKNCGTVMQDGYIFSDTIAQNIALSGAEIDEKRMFHATDVANISEFIESLPLKYTTKIGANGIGLSGGQLQRILIARAVYKSPHYLFFDEATSALDAGNESLIINKLQSFFKGKTVVIIAHRLSTVKNADQIIVLEKGRIAETGNHQTLTEQRGTYFQLVKNQLELGS